MPEPSAEANALITWLSENGPVLAAVAIAAFIIYRWSRPLIHRLLVRVIHASEADAAVPSTAAETDRRIETIEDLLAKLLRAGVVGAVVVVVLGIFDLWSLLAGLGLILAAITLAGQSIVLDYLMGILILSEGQYSKGDVVRIGPVEGTVEEVGLRRTLVRDVRGTLHSISNGEIRSAANLTRTFARATVNIDGIADRDIETVIAILDQVGKDLEADPEVAPFLLDTPGYGGTTRLTSAGATLRLWGRVRPEGRVQVEGEMRRRVAAGMAAAGVEPIRPTTYGGVPPS